MWLRKLEKAQDGLANPAVAAALLRKLFPRCEALRSSCEQLIAKSKRLPDSLDRALRSSVESLKSLLEVTALENRVKQLDDQDNRIASTATALEVDRFNQQLAEIAREINSVRKVLQAIKAE